jgi:hypothetical protein
VFNLGEPQRDLVEQGEQVEVNTDVLKPVSLGALRRDRLTGFWWSSTWIAVLSFTLHTIACLGANPGPGASIGQPQNQAGVPG